MKCVIKEESGICVPRVGTTTCFNKHLLSRKLEYNICCCFFFCKSFLYHNNSLFLKKINETANFLTENFLIL